LRQATADPIFTETETLRQIGGWEWRGTDCIF
jgi:hypothetical protein